MPNAEPQGLKVQMWRLGIWGTAGLFLFIHPRPAIPSPPALPSFQGSMPSAIPKSRHSQKWCLLTPPPARRQVPLVRRGSPRSLPLALTPKRPACSLTFPCRMLPSQLFSGFSEACVVPLLGSCCTHLPLASD